MANPPVFPRVMPASELEPWDYGPQNLARTSAARPRGNLVASPGGGAIPEPEGPLGPGRWIALPHQYADPVTEIVVAVGTTAIKVIDRPNNFRNLLIIRNPNAAAILYARFDAEPTINSTLSILAGERICLDAVVPQGDLWILSDTAGMLVSVSYSTIDLPPKDY